MSENYPIIDIDQVGLKGGVIDPSELFESTKRREREMSTQQATIDVIGSLSGGESRDLWRGKISLQSRLDSGEINPDELESATKRVNQFYVPVSKGASIRCVDGSGIKGYDKQSAIWYGRPLGPQVAGGTAGAALAMRLTSGANPGATLLNDIERIAEDYSRDYLSGDHTDDQVGDSKTGCGEIDEGLPKLAAIVGPLTGQIIKSKADAIMASGGMVAEPGAFEKIQNNARVLQEIEGYYSPAKEILEKIKSLNPSGVEVLVRPHSEITLTINWQPLTTFDRDAYNSETDSKIGNFNLDAWAIFEEFGEEIGYAMIVDAVATVMAISDGSPLLLVRRPVEEPTPVS